MFKKLEETMCVHVRHLSQDALLSYFNFFPNCFSKIYVAELGVQHICECGFDVYDT